MPAPAKRGRTTGAMIRFGRRSPIWLLTVHMVGPCQAPRCEENHQEKRRRREADDDRSSGRARVVADPAYCDASPVPGAISTGAPSQPSHRPR